MKNKTWTVLKTNEGMALLAFFDGWEKHPNWPNYVHNPPKHLNENGNCSIDNLRYDESWDWLMPVIHKILKTTEPMPGQGWSYEYIELEKSRVGNSIDYLFMKAVEFVKRYYSERGVSF